MSQKENEHLHGRILTILLTLREYDHREKWDDDIREEVRRMLSDLEYYTKRERLYYEKYRDIMEICE